MKERYLDLMEKVLTAYTPEHIGSYTRDVERRGITEHGYARLTSNIGILIAHGRLGHMKESFRHMMDLCCEGIPTAREKPPPRKCCFCGPRPSPRRRCRKRFRRKGDRLLPSRARKGRDFRKGSHGRLETRA